MGLGLLPWEKWLPAWLFGPLLCIGSIAVLVVDRSLHWWEFILLPLTALLGVIQTWIWFTQGRNILGKDSLLDKSNNEEIGQ